MPSSHRRVVTGHDEDGRAVVLFDGPLEPRSNRPGVGFTVVWSTPAFPADNSGDDDAAERPVGIALPGGAVFRLVEFEPGNQGMMHRTETVDYAVVVRGEIDMELDDGATVHLRAGDTLVQRGTIHSWLNRGDEPCLIAFVLIDAHPVEVGGRVLREEGVPPPPAGI